MEIEREDLGGITGFHGRIDGIEQNPETGSRWALLAREGKRIMQFSLERRYIGNVAEGELVRYADEKCFAALIRHLYKKQWVVYAKPAFGGPMQQSPGYAARPPVLPYGGTRSE